MWDTTGRGGTCFASGKARLPKRGRLWVCFGFLGVGTRLWFCFGNICRGALGFQGAGDLPSAWAPSILRISFSATERARGGLGVGGCWTILEPQPGQLKKLQVLRWTRHPPDHWGSKQSRPPVRGCSPAARSCERSARTGLQPPPPPWLTRGGHLRLPPLPRHPTGQPAQPTEGNAGPAAAHPVVPRASARGHLAQEGPRQHGIAARYFTCPWRPPAKNNK